jgi:hypothetical protein
MIMERLYQGALPLGIRRIYPSATFALGVYEYLARTSPPQELLHRREMRYTSSLPCSGAPACWRSGYQGRILRSALPTSFLLYTEEVYQEVYPRRSASPSVYLVARTSPKGRSITYYLLLTLYSVKSSKKKSKYSVYVSNKK